MPLETIPPVIGLLYVIIGIPLNAYIWYKGKFSKKIRVAFSLISVALGFLIFSPMAPFQLQSIALNDTQSLGFPVAGAIAFMVLFIVLVLVAGRIFCGYLCPIGAVQELAYEVPAKKARLLQKSTLFAIRSVFFILFFAMAFFLSTGILDFFGIRQFFYLDVASIFFVVFIVIILVSVFFYRPFCRIACPLGALYTAAGMASLLKIRRTAACTECGKCEEACPTGEAKKGDAKGDCYLCGRCVEACPAGALSYRRR
jgi:ferredoxin-type protein NapH